MGLFCPPTWAPKTRDVLPINGRFQPLTTEAQMQSLPTQVWMLFIPIVATKRSIPQMLTFTRSTHSTLKWQHWEAQLAGLALTQCMSAAQMHPTLTLTLSTSGQQWIPSWLKRNTISTTFTTLSPLATGVPSQTLRLLTTTLQAQLGLEPSLGSWQVPTSRVADFSTFLTPLYPKSSTLRWGLLTPTTSSISVRQPCSPSTAVRTTSRLKSHLQSLLSILLIATCTNRVVLLYLHTQVLLN